MAKKNEYVDEAYQELLNLSADDIKRLQYESREKAIRDYNSQINSAEERGEKRGAETLGKLVCLLMQEKRYDDIERVSNDAVYREILLKEFQIK